MIDVRVADELEIRQHRRAIYALFSLILTLMEIGFSLGSALAIFMEKYDASAAFSMSVTAIVAVDTAIRVKERAAWHHAAYLQLRNINSALLREKTQRKTHPLQEELDALLADAPIDLIACATEVCWKPPMPVLARDVQAVPTKQHPAP